MSRTPSAIAARPLSTRRLFGWLRLALVDLGTDWRRFAILIACLALGVGTIGLVGTTGAALQSALLRDARLLLGGDLEASLSYRRADAAERAYFAGLGPVSEAIDVMGRGRSAETTTFLAIRAVDDLYPLVGSATLDMGAEGLVPMPLADRLTEREDRFGLVADPLLLDRLQIAVGDDIEIGAARFVVTGLLGRLPDALGSSIGIGVPVVMSVAALEATGILAPGVLARHRYRVLLEGADYAEAAEAIRARFPEAGFQLSAPRDATADLARFFDIFSRFLVVVGLSVLLVGGVGVSNAVSAYLAERQRSIATFKALGATGGRVTAHFLTQVMLLVLVGSLAGLALGSLFALIALPILSDALGLELALVLDWPSLATALAFGLLTGFAFGYLPLERARRTRPALLFRAVGSAPDEPMRWRNWLRPGLVLPLALAAAGVLVLAIVTTGRPTLVLYYALAVLAGFIVLRLAAAGLQRLIRLVPAPRRRALRHALRAVHLPGAPAPMVIVSLGVGLALLLLVALIDGNLRRMLDREAIPDAPSFVFMDVFPDEVEALADFAATDSGIAGFEAMPLMRGRIEAINGTPVEALERTLPPEFAFLFEEEIPITSAAELPPRSTITAGAWWSAAAAGTPEVSVFDRLRGPLGLEVGDTLTLRIFGDAVTARIASFRDYVWRSGNVNFAFVFSPETFDPFPLSYMGLMQADAGAERAVQSRIVATFPDLIFIPVSEALEAFQVILSGVTGAIQAIGGLALASGALVLAGAMLASRQQREADAVTMKVLGATRGDIVAAYVLEYGLLGLLAAALAALLGVAGSWAFVSFVLELDFTFDPALVATVIGANMLLTVLVGTLATWSALSVRPARFLRAD